MVNKGLNKEEVINNRKKYGTNEINIQKRIFLIYFRII